MNNHTLTIIKVALGVCMVFALLTLFPSNLQAQTFTEECFQGDCDNGWGSYRWEDGSRAEGKWRRGRFLKGALYDVDGSFWLGKFKDYNLKGYGTLCLDGYSVSCKWKNGEAIGVLYVEYDDGVCWSGNISELGLDGQGCVYFPLDDSLRIADQFCGEFKDGVLLISDSVSVNQYGDYSTGEFDGFNLIKGDVFYYGGTHESGEFFDGILNGKGKREWKNGALEEGVFLMDDLIDGIVIDGGLEMEGHFINDDLFGEGRIYEKGEYEITGNFDMSRLHGEGRVEFYGGEVYEGVWSRGKLELENNGGVIKKVNQRGVLMEGEWRGNYLTKGTCIYPNGAVYVGGHKDGMFHGKGKYTENDGTTIEGDWLENYFTGQGVYKYHDGVTVTGSFVNEEANGPGEIVLPDGSSFSGNWEDGILLLNDTTLINQRGEILD
jgi:hypothetical protein